LEEKGRRRRSGTRTFDIMIGLNSRSDMDLVASPSSAPLGGWARAGKISNLQLQQFVFPLPYEVTIVGNIPILPCPWFSNGLGICFFFFPPPFSLASVGSTFLAAQAARLVFIPNLLTQRSWYY
jgi:hypothetical protein